MRNFTLSKGSDFSDDSKDSPLQLKGLIIILNSYLFFLTLEEKLLLIVDFIVQI